MTDSHYPALSTETLVLVFGRTKSAGDVQSDPQRLLFLGSKMTVTSPFPYLLRRLLSNTQVQLSLIQSLARQLGVSSDHEALTDLQRAVSGLLSLSEEIALVPAGQREALVEHAMDGVRAVSNRLDAVIAQCRLLLSEKGGSNRP